MVILSCNLTARYISNAAGLRRHVNVFAAARALGADACAVERAACPLAPRPTMGFPFHPPPNQLTLIESDGSEGTTTVYDPRGKSIGSIKRLMIEKVSGRVAYAVLSFGGFLRDGCGRARHLGRGMPQANYLGHATSRPGSPLWR